MFSGLSKLPQSSLRKIRYLYHLCRMDKLSVLINELRTNYIVPKIKRNYLKTLQREKKLLRQKHILFLVNDSSKWKLQSVYMRFQECGFKVSIGISLYGWTDCRAKAEALAYDTFNYFKGKSMNVFYAYDFQSHKPISLEEFSPDFVFYEQPWEIFPEHMPCKVSRFAITGYVSYDVPCTTIAERHCALPFHRQLYVHFVINKKMKMEMESFLKSRKTASRIIATGHPVFDEFVKSFPENGNLSKERVVIYAPHWAFPHKNNPNMFDSSTFLWSGNVILEYAKFHPEIKWIFKPHPVLKSMLIKSGVMSVDEVEGYYNSWSKIGKCCFSSDYTAYFINSCVLITDSMSFLLEYGCTGRPIIHLMEKEQKVKFSSIYKSLFDSYYKVYSQNDLYRIFKQVIEDGEDPCFEKRKYALRELEMSLGSASKEIVRECESILTEK